MDRILGLFGIDTASPAERRATLWTAAMFGAALASTYVLRPLRDQFGVEEGVDRLPYLYTLTLLVTAVFVPAFWWLAHRRPSRRFVPQALWCAIGALAALFVGLRSVGAYDWRAARWVGEAFWGGYSAFNAAVPTLVWVHAVEYFRRDQGMRLFGLVGVGGTAGAVAGSALARQLAEWKLEPSSAAAAAAVLLATALLRHRRSLRACEAMVSAAGATSARTVVAVGGAFDGVRLLARDRHLQAIAGYMLLLAMVATAFAVAQTELVGKQVAGARAQHGFLAQQEVFGQGLVLALQLFLTGRLMPRLPPAMFLCLIPVLSIIGLGALWIWPTAIAVAIVQILRRGAQYAFEKPAREVLYTPLPLETKHKVKFLLDTFVWRLGDLLGALYQVSLLRGKASLGRGGVLAATVALAVVWIALGARLGRRPRP